MLIDMSLEVQKEILETMKKENRTLLAAEAVVVMRKIKDLMNKIVKSNQKRED